MRASKIFITSLLTLGLALVLAPNTFARSYDHEVHLTGTLTGQYGAQVGNTAYRYSNYSGYSPVNILTGTANVSKFLYGLSTQITGISTDNKSVHYMEFGFKLSSNGADADFYADGTQHWYLGVKYSSSSSSFTEITPDLCSGTTSSSSGGQVKHLDYTCTATFKNGQAPVAVLIQDGIIGNFVHQSDSPIAISTGSSVNLVDVWYKWSSADGTSDGDSSAAIDNLGNTMEDIHNDEKDTINQNADDAQDSADGLNIGFSVGNPFLTWFNLFTDQPCVQIPTIASWLHANETQVCSPWRDTPVRAVATPICSVLGGMILFGFIVRWLKGSDFDGSIELDG